MITNGRPAPPARNQSACSELRQTPPPSGDRENAPGGGKRGAVGGASPLLSQWGGRARGGPDAGSGSGSGSVPVPVPVPVRCRPGSFIAVAPMEPAEAEFLAEKELVTIVPNFSLDRIHLIGGDLGPFNPGLPVEVPVWLAINLKQRQKCRLIPPEWMDVEKLEEIRDQERKEDTFTPMPSPYYMELTKLLLNYASDNIPKADEIRTLVKDTWDTRIAKLRLSADSFVRQQEAHAKLDNLTLMEINTTGTFLTQALNHMYKLRTNLQPGESAHSQDF